jgi:hypothetical protein
MHSHHFSDSIPDTSSFINSFRHILRSPFESNLKLARGRQKSLLKLHLPFVYLGLKLVLLANSIEKTLDVRTAYGTSA